jgi:hypothetical protein
MEMEGRGTCRVPWSARRGLYRWRGETLTGFIPSTIFEGRYSLPYGGIQDAMSLDIA